MSVGDNVSNYSCENQSASSLEKSRPSSVTLAKKEVRVTVAKWHVETMIAVRVCLKVKRYYWYGLMVVFI